MGAPGSPGLRRFWSPAWGPPPPSGAPRGEMQTRPLQESCRFRCLQGSEIPPPEDSFFPLFLGHI